MPPVGRVCTAPTLYVQLLVSRLEAPVKALVAGCVVDLLPAAEVR